MRKSENKEREADENEIEVPRRHSPATKDEQSIILFRDRYKPQI